MVKPVFENLAIDFWVHAGKLGVNQPTLCLFHDSFHKGSPILGALTEFKSIACPAKLTLTFAPCSRRRSLSKLKLSFVVKRDELQVMNIRVDADVATIEMTDEGLACLSDAVKAWLNGAEDFGVSPNQSNIRPNTLGKLDLESGELWFWGPGYYGP